MGWGECLKIADLQFVRSRSLRSGHWPARFGNLWIAGADFTVGILDEIEMISAADLIGAGEVSPPFAVTITSAAFGTEPGLAGGICLGGIDFDHSGDLWASAHCDPETHLMEFTPSQLSLGGDLTPSVTISPNSRKTTWPILVRSGSVL